MDPKELESKMRAFLEKELPSEYYQCVITYSNGKQGSKAQPGIMISTVLVGNADPSNTPFAVFHGIMRTLEMQVKGMLVNIYGGEIKPENKEQPQNYYG